MAMGRVAYDGYAQEPERLQVLIKRRKAALRLTWHAMEQRTIAAGHHVSSSMLHHWVGETWTNIPPTETLHGLAAALELDVDDVLAAAAVSLNLRLHEPSGEGFAAWGAGVDRAHRRPKPRAGRRFGADTPNGPVRNGFR